MAALEKGSNNLTFMHIYSLRLLFSSSFFSLSLSPALNNAEYLIEQNSAWWRFTNDVFLLGGKKVKVKHTAGVKQNELPGWVACPSRG